MLVINVVEDKIPANVYPELIEWVRDLNSIREEPIKLTMFVEDDIVRGIMAWEPGHLVYMVVPEESRRGGVGKFMLKYLQQNSDRKRVSCRVHPTNIPALGFFHQQGFQIDRWYIAADGQRYFRMTNYNVISSHTPSEEKLLTHYAESVPIFLSMAEGHFV